MENNKGKTENPFASFSLLEGRTPVPNDVDDDIIQGDDALIEDTDSQEDTEDEKFKASKALADAKLKEIVEKQSKKTVNPIVEDSEEDDDSIEDTDDEDVNGFKTAIQQLSDKGILEIDETDIEDSEEGLEKAIDKTVSSRFEKYLESRLGEEGIALLSYIEAGGKPKDFISTYYNDSSWAEFSVDSETAQKIALRESLKLKRETPEDIEDLISEYEENGTLEKRAKSALAFLQHEEAQEKEYLIENQKKAAENAKIAEKKRFEDFKNDILKRDDIKGFKLTPKLKEKLIDFTTTVDKKTGKTGYQQAAESDKDAFLLFALQAMNNFDVSKLEKQVMTKVSSKLGGMLKNYKTPGRDRISSGRTEIDETGDNPFSGFRSV